MICLSKPDAFSLYSAEEYYLFFYTTCDKFQANHNSQTKVIKVENLMKRLLSTTGTQRGMGGGELTTFVSNLNEDSVTVLNKGLGWVIFLSETFCP